MGFMDRCVNGGRWADGWSGCGILLRNLARLAILLASVFLIHLVEKGVRNGAYLRAGWYIMDINAVAQHAMNGGVAILVIIKQLSCLSYTLLYILSGIQGRGAIEQSSNILHSPFVIAA